MLWSRHLGPPSGIAAVQGCLLDDGQVVITRLEPIRREHGLLAARIRPCSASRHALNRFLFQKHRANHPGLYQGARLPTAIRDN